MAQKSCNRKKVLVIAASLLLGACESVSLPSSITELLPAIPSLKDLGSLPSFANINPFDEQRCAKVDDKDIKKVNWTRAPEVNMRVRGDEFEPMIVQMKQGWPYVFRIRNRDDKVHVFTSRDFFTHMAVIRITVDGKRQDETCVTRVKIPPKKTVEMRLVAAIDGRFEFEDTLNPIPGFFSHGASGVIIVEDRFAVRYQ